jgi:hypothetical protein
LKADDLFGRDFVFRINIEGGRSKGGHDIDWYDIFLKMQTLLKQVLAFLIINATQHPENSMEEL